MATISVEELAARLDEPNIQLVDVREPEEIAIAVLDRFTLLPLSQFERWSGQIKEILDPTLETLVLCHHGVRSGQMCQWLSNQGFSNVKNITGGIDYYSLKVDDSIPRY
ncbi:MAG: rhodanese-related sulfurtransferase [Synechococcaceae cyanobacterium RL_1_2]|nr:rhodanese-related sulfurtransferase [Synechococcaceae cyanobacterium RL_1_2]